MFVYNAHYNITCSVDIVIFVQLAISVKNEILYFNNFSSF